MVYNYAYGEELYYHGMNEHIPISIVPNKVALYRESDITKETVANVLAQNHLTVSWKYDQLCVVDNMNLQMLPASLSDVNLDISYLPVYMINDEIEVVLFYEIIVKPRNDYYDMTEIIRQYNMTLKKDGGIYQVYALPVESEPISIANAIYETGEFDFAYPHFYTPAETFSYIPNDPYFQYQITCHNVGQVFNDGHYGAYDADIDAPEAWEITKGSSDIVIAVFDEGVTSNHPDLPNSRQIRLNGSNFGSGDPNDPSPQGNGNHGNACAGVIAASMDNNEGIAGIAPNCKIMPLRWDSSTDETGMADGIKFAVDNGANVISCSWGYGTSIPTLHPVIVTAIEYAINNNVIVIFAAGNTAWHSQGNSGFVTFPASSYVNNLITVGASDRYDAVAEYSPSSSLIDVAAPSHRAYPSQISNEHAEMWSLDIPGNAGYNPMHSDFGDPYLTGTILPNFGTNHLSYTGRFGGTSHACPVVAGVVALMLSVNPSLLPDQVYSILTNTCDKVGGYSYINGKSSELGYGRVNAYAAVMAAKIKYIQNEVYSQGSVIVEKHPEIIAGYAVTNSKPYGNVFLEAGSDITYIASERVMLKPGFHAQTGSNLQIKIEELTNNISTVPQYVAPRSSSVSTEDKEPTDEVVTSNSLENVESEMIQSTAIYTISGQLLQTIEGSQYDAAHLPDGMYILQHRMSDGSMRNEKVTNYK